MCNRWKKVVAVLGAALMLVNVNGTLTVRAEETVQEESGKGGRSGQEEAGQEETGKANGEEAGQEETGKANGEEAGQEEAGKANGEEAGQEETGNENGEEAENGESGKAVVTAELSSEEQSGLQPATDLCWDSENPGHLKFYNPNDEKISVGIKISYNGYEQGRISFWMDSEDYYSMDVSSYIENSGEYTFQVAFFEEGVETDWSFETGSVSDISPIFQYTRPEAQVGIATNIQWDSTGYVTWDAVEHADYYDSFLYRKNGDVYEWVAGYGSWTCFANYGDKIAEGYTYAVRVRATSSNVNEYANGNWSDYILFDNSESVDEINSTLGEATTEENLAPDKIEGTVQGVKDAFAADDKKKELQVAMQSDEATQDKVGKLEESYSQQMGVSVSAKANEDTGIDTSSVQLLGAALNATEPGSITFNMSKPDEQTQKDLITETPYTKGIVLDLGLEGAGIEKGEALDIPVTVTMPVPAGIELSKLAILHFNQNTKNYEVLPIRMNSDGTISFTVTHFSYFAFVEAEEPVIDNGSNGSGKDSYCFMTSSSSEGGSIVVEAWQPRTPDELKRYAAYGREKVVYSMDQKNTYPITIRNAMQGKKCFDSFEAVLGEYTMGRTYNILPNGQKLYKMDQAVTFTITIPKELQAKDREFQMICVTEKGLPIILKDQDQDPSTITVTTNQFYAFALVYQDAEVKNK